MTDEADIRAAHEALARASEVGGSAARAARRTVRLYLYATGAAMALAGLASGLVGHWVDPAATWSRAALTALLWGGLFGAVSVLVNSQPVRALPARRLTVTLGLVSAVILGVTMGVGWEYPAAYVVGAAVVFGVWALGAAWVGR